MLYRIISVFLRVRVCAAENHQKSPAPAIKCLQFQVPEPTMLYVSTAHLIGMIFGLPEVTVFAVGGAILVITFLLILWAVTFPKMEE